MRTPRQALALGKPCAIAEDTLFNQFRAIERVLDEKHSIVSILSVNK